MKTKTIFERVELFDRLTFPGGDLFSPIPPRNRVGSHVYLRACSLHPIPSRHNSFTNKFISTLLAWKQCDLDLTSKKEPEFAD